MIDWSRPIVWHDGTPAECHPEPRWGTIAVYVDEHRLPEGVRFNGHPWREFYPDGRPFIYVNMTSGRLQDPASGIHAYIENVTERAARELMDELAQW